MRNVNDSAVAQGRTSIADWRALYETSDMQRARMVATCLSAMEYEVHVVSNEGDELEAILDAPDLDPPQRFIVRVPAADLPQLADIIDEIVDEQEQFDAFIDDWRNRAGRAERRLLIAMIVLVGGLAAAGVIEV